MATRAEMLVNGALLLVVPAALISGGRFIEQKLRSGKPAQAEREANWERIVRIPAAQRRHVEVVWYADFECEYCRLANRTLRSIEDSSANVRVNFRHLPLTLHSFARQGAELAECARRQGAWPAMRDVLFSFAAPGEVGVSGLMRQARIADTLALLKCMSDEQIHERVTADSAEARGLGVIGTPHIIINGWAFRGFPGDSILRAFIRDQLANAIP